MKIVVLFKPKDKSAVMSSAKCIYIVQNAFCNLCWYITTKKKKKTYADISWGIILYMDDVE